MTQTYDLTDTERRLYELAEHFAQQTVDEYTAEDVERIAEAFKTWDASLLYTEDRRTVYERMVAVIGELPAIGKTQRNQQQGFMFRGHDDVMNALNPLLAKHGVFVVPDVRERITGERTTDRGKTMYEVNLHVRFTFYGLLGDSFTASGWGEGTDMGDKATNKAMTMAFKYVVAQAFALATAETSDADAGSPEETSRGAERAERQQNQPRTAREFDPGKTLSDGAMAVKNADDATALQQAQRDLDPTQDWAAIETFLAESVFGIAQTGFTPAQWGEWWNRLANAVWKVNQLAGPGDFPPPSLEQLRDGYAWAFKGTVVAFSGPETAAEPEAGAETSAPEEAA